MIKWLEKHRIASLIITILIIIEIFYLSSLSFGKGQSTKGISFIPTIYHFVVFFLLSFFVLITIKGNRKEKKYFVITFITSISYAFFDEIHQLFVPFRTFSLQDIFIDFTGIIFAIIINLKINKNRIK
ncbi:MAG: VanZ family protein [Nanoarchaeota archaeon]